LSEVRLVKLIDAGIEFYILITPLQKKLLRISRVHMAYRRDLVLLSAFSVNISLQSTATIPDIIL